MGNILGRGASNALIPGGLSLRVNSGIALADRAQLNLIPGPNISIGAVDDSGDGETEVTISATGISGIVGLSHGASGTSRTVNVPANTLTVDGQSLIFRGTGVGAGAVIRMRFAGVEIGVPGAVNGEGVSAYVFDGQVIRTSSTTAIAWTRLIYYGQDADVGSNLEEWVRPYVTVGANFATGLDFILDFPAPAVGSLVNILHVRAER